MDPSKTDKDENLNASLKRKTRMFVSLHRLTRMFGLENRAHDTSVAVYGLKT